MEFVIESYIFNTLTGEGLIDLIDNPTDAAHTIHTIGEKLSDNRIKIWSDDGNSSSYGFDIWQFSDDRKWVTLMESYGRDCFDNNLSDGYDPATPGLLRIGVDEFDRMLQLHISDIEYRACNQYD